MKTFCICLSLLLLLINVLCYKNEGEECNSSSDCIYPLLCLPLKTHSLCISYSAPLSKGIRKQESWEKKRRTRQSDY